MIEKFLELWLLWNFNDFVFETFPRAIKTNKLHHISRVMDWNKNILQNYFTIEIYLHVFPRPISNLAILYFSISEVPNFVFVIRTLSCSGSGSGSTSKFKRHMSKLDPEVGVVMGWPTTTHHHRTFFELKTAN